MASYRVTLVNTQESYDCADDVNLLKAMEKLGRKGIPVGCRGGGCGVCKVRVEAGSVKKGKMSRAHVSAEEEAQGMVLACCAFPQSDLELRAIEQMARCLEKSVQRSFRDMAAAARRQVAEQAGDQKQTTETS